MAFCKFCGKELKEGEVCSCPEAQAANPQTSAASAPTPAVAAPSPAVSAPTPAPGATTLTVTLPSKEAVNTAAKNIFSTIINVLAHPASGAKAFVQNANRLVAIGIMVIHAILSSIFGVIIIAQVNSGLPDQYKSSVVGAFFVTLLFSVIFSALMTALVLAATKILKLTASLDQVLAIASVRSIICIPLTILACIISLFNNGWGLGLFYGSILVIVIFLLEAVKGLENASEDKVVYAVCGITVIFAILFALLGTKVAFNMYLSENLANQFKTLLNMF